MKNKQTNRVVSFPNVNDCVVAKLATIAPPIPEIKPGIPCKLLTPHVSCKYIFLSKGVKYSKPSVETTPATLPISIADEGRIAISAIVPCYWEEIKKNIYNN